MGLGLDGLDAILREHKNRPIDGDVLIIGRQTVYFSPEDVLAMMRGYGIESHLRLEEIEIDTDTINWKSGTDTNRKFISDLSLFRMLGAKSVRALDHSEYEGAEVVHDLTKPLKPELRGIADFIVDGSTLDNTFNPALTLTNYVDLLRPRGRLLMINMFSNDHEPYNTQPPLWYVDYFTVNKFLDCKVYVLVFSPTASNSFCINYESLMDPKQHVSSFVSPHEMATVVFAEKGEESTSDVYPSQQHYRSDAEWRTYRENLAKIMTSTRPHLSCSRSPIGFFEARGGHLFMNAQYEPVDPTGEAMRVVPLATFKRKVAWKAKHWSTKKKASNG